MATSLVCPSCQEQKLTPAQGEAPKCSACGWTKPLPTAAVAYVRNHIDGWADKDSPDDVVLWCCECEHEAVVPAHEKDISGYSGPGADVVVHICLSCGDLQGGGYSRTCPSCNAHYFDEAYDPEAEEEGEGSAKAPCPSCHEPAI